MKKQAGNVIEWLILGVVLIGVVALIAWRYMETDKDQNGADQANSNSQVAQQPKDTVKLGDWKVELKDVPKKYGTITANLYKQESGDSYILTSSKLKDGTFTCDATTDNGKRVLGMLNRSDTDDPMTDDVKIGDKYYNFISSLQNNCYKEAELNTLGKEFAKDLPTVLVETKN